MFWRKSEISGEKLRAYAYKSGAFDNKKSAFDYFFIIENKDIEEANRLAELMASARGIPDVPQAAETWADKIKKLLKQGSDLATENPKIAEFLIGLVGGAATSLTGVAVGNAISENETKHEFSNEQPKEINNAEPI